MKKNKLNSASILDMRVLGERGIFRFGDELVLIDELAPKKRPSHCYIGGRLVYCYGKKCSERAL